MNSLFFLGLALATSITETLCRSEALVIIATHFQQLTSVGYIYRNVANYHFDVIYNEKIEDGESIKRFHPQTILDRIKEQNTIVYSYTLRPGICKDLHYGKKGLSRRQTIKFKSFLGLALASQIEDLQTVVELAKCVAKFYIRKKEVFYFRNKTFVLNTSNCFLVDYESYVKYSKFTYETCNNNERFL